MKSIYIGSATREYVCCSLETHVKLSDKHKGILYKEAKKWKK
jgi:hypothetical protein